MHWIMHDALVGVRLVLRNKETGARESHWTVDDHDGRYLYRNWFDSTKGVALDSVEAVPPQPQDQDKLWIIVKGEHIGKYCKSVIYKKSGPTHKVRIVINKAEVLSDTGVEMEIEKDSINIVFQEARHREGNRWLTFHKANRRQVVDKYSTELQF